MCVLLAAPAWAQLTDADIAALQAQGEREGWTFTVAKNPATEQPLENLCGFVVPDNWWVGARFDPCPAQRTLPPAYDWRDHATLPPVRNQGGCGSCWAFGTIGPLECNIAIKDGMIVDTSEQWLVSCNSDGWGCGGGWWAHDYLQWKTDPCGGTGAVPESAFPYVAWDAPCNCPYPHDYLIEDWAFIGNDYSVPPVDNMKQAILDHGPISVAVYVNSAFQGYNGGIFTGCGGGEVNHAVTLVGWDDNGGNGYWIMRNSWGGGWGESGYMRIQYNCSSIGYAACYIVYNGMGGLQVTPADDFAPTGPAGGPFVPGSAVYTLENTSGLNIDYSVSHVAPWLTVTNGSGTLAAHATVQVTVAVNSAANSLGEGRYTDTLSFVNLTNHNGDATRGARLQVGYPVQMYNFSLDTNPGWTTQGEWAFGQPTGEGGGAHGYPDPTSGATSTDVYGVNLQGDYSTVYGGPYYLTAGPLNLGTAKGAVLQFKRWLNSDYPPYVFVMLEASFDGSSWTSLWTNSKLIKENAWSAWSFDLPASFDYQPTVYLRWGYRISNGAMAYSGWNLDDIEIWAFGQPPSSKGDLNCDGVVSFGDINPFVLALTNPTVYATTFPNCDVMNADMNSDGSVNFGDINPFVAALIPQ
jgi:C1A family cysteine protease